MTKKLAEEAVGAGGRGAPLRLSRSANNFHLREKTPFQNCTFYPLSHNISKIFTTKKSIIALKTF